MKVCIVTLYKTINSGSYLQAKALGIAVEKLGHECVYLDVPYRIKNRLAKYIKILKIYIKGGYNAARDYVLSLCGFYKKHRELKIVANQKASLCDVDCMVLGSDTIWNLESFNLAVNRKVFWGGNFSGKRVITYAGSVANTKFADVERYPELKDYVNQWSAISVRDEKTCEIISALTEKRISLVCDPTLLLGKNEYFEIMTKKNTICEQKYIFLYLFMPLDSKQSAELRKFTDENEYMIVQGAKPKAFDISDKVAVNTPDDFLACMANAEYVVTDTFHGTVFSVNFNKQFVSIERGKNKVNEFLKQMGLEERLVSSEDDLESVLTFPIKYDDVNYKIAQSREKSFSYLKEALSSKSTKE